MVRAGRRAGRGLGQGRYLEVNYEQLVSDPEATLRDICAFISVEYREEMLSYPDHALQALPEHARGLDKNLTRPPIAGLRDWRRDLAARSISICEAVAASQLRRLGYVVSEPRPSLRLRVETALQVYSWSVSRRRRAIHFWLGRTRFKVALRVKRFSKRLLDAFGRRVSRTS
jgi:hypothetical protein